MIYLLKNSLKKTQGLLLEKNIQVIKYPNNGRLANPRNLDRILADQLR